MRETDRQFIATTRRDGTGGDKESSVATRADTF